MTDIDTLAATVKAGLDRDEKAAQRNICGLTCISHQVQDWHRVRNQLGRGGTRAALESVRLGMLGQDWPDMPEGNHHTIHYALMGRTAMDPANVLRRVSRDRRLLDLLLAEPHYAWDDRDEYGCPRRTPGLYEGEHPCTCGRDERVAGLLAVLAEAYEETT